MQKNLNEDFIEDYSEQFASKVSNEFFKNKTHISGQEILTITPSKQVNFFIIKLLFNNWQEESQRLESPFFDYSANDVKEAMVQFMNVLSRHIKVGQKEFEVLLLDAVRDTLFLIMAPNVYMEIEIDRKGTETLTEKSARNVTKYIRIAKDALSENIMTFVGSDRDEIQLDESIITPEILENEISLLNKVLPLTLKKLEEGDEEEDILKVETDDVFVERKSSQPEVEAVTEVPKTTETPVEAEIPETIPEGEESTPVAPEQEPEQDETPQIKEIQEPIDTPPEKQEIITNLDPDDEDEDDEDAILNSKFEDPMVGSIAESHEKTDSMLNAISLNHRYMFINELFDGEADLFAEAIERVDAATSFDSAVEMLVQNYAKEFHWDMNSDEVKELLKIIFRRFR